MATPVRRQYLDLKARHPDAILFFRLGDFYETFDEDAKLISEELDIALTSKPMGGGLRAPLAGVPVRSVEHHLARLVERGHRVAVCEQLEDARAAKGLVRRGVVRVVSAGTALEPALLEAGEASACAALNLTRRGRQLTLGIAACDVTTGACHTTELTAQEQDAPDLWLRARDLLERLGARELLVPEQAKGGAAAAEELCRGLELPVTRQPAARFTRREAERALDKQYGAPAAAFGLDQRPAALGAVGAVIDYLRTALPASVGEAASGGADAQSQPAQLAHLAPPRWLEATAHLQWERSTQRALGVIEAPDAADASQTDGPQTLLEVVDHCGSAPGRRWLRSALAAPLLDLDRIQRRLDRVEALTGRPDLRRALTERLRGTPDLERLLGRAASGLALPSELAQLARGLVGAEELSELLRESAPSGGEDAGVDSALRLIAERLGPAPGSALAAAEALEERPAQEFGSGVVRTGADPEIDRERALMDEARDELSGLERELRQETGIDGLRVGFHRTFGYHIELTRSQAARAPESWERRQSLRDRERFTEPRLRELERKIETAEARLAEAERACTERLRQALVRDALEIRQIAGAQARLDAACALAQAASARAWTRPELDHSGELEIEGGRHPVVEAASAQGAFVPNDLSLADDGSRAPQLLLVTGPNMAGKSTYLRQTALIAALAQAGSFVPARRARIGLVDRIFARVGAHDDLARGRSTFMVEMLETAQLLNGATERSLVLLDEIGRGTSTWDGLAIAQAVTERLASGERGPRTLFATHFHELTALSGRLARVANASVQVDETEAGQVVFRYRIQPGAADRSYGVHVAAQAGLPQEVIRRAAELLEALEQGAPAPAPQPALPASQTSQAGQASPQLMLMPPAEHPILRDLADLDIDGITPLEAISSLYALRDQALRELRELRGRERGGGSQAAGLEAGS